MLDRTQSHFQEFWQRAPAGPCRPAGSYILLTFGGQKNEAEASLERVQDLVLKNGALDCIILKDSARAADIWKVRGNRDAETWERELHAVMDRACHRAYELGGAASGEHGIGVSKRRYFLRETRRENLTVMNQIKDILYPLHILNDQKSYIGGHDYAEPV